jgi:hydroxyquinol 1,2-dioxygenase
VFATSSDGSFHYTTVRPAGYSVPGDGPVGQMLAGIGYPLRRPAHLHFLIKADGFETISTHVYDGGDPHLAEDALFGVKPELVGAFRRAGKQRNWSLDFTFVMIRARKEKRAA